MGTIRIGIGGWTYAPWRGAFYPPKLPHKAELGHAAGRLTAIEINGSYYSSFPPETWAGWGRAVPDGFRFAVKASRYCTNRKRLADGAESVARFLGQGIVELGDRLGPILWQFMATKRFDPDDFAGFLALLPGMRDGVALRHVLEVRHESFRDPAFAAMAEAANVAVVHAESDEHPLVDVVSGGFRYARLMRSREEEPAGYPPAELDRWATTLADWAKAGDVYAFVISGAKVRAPAAAEALIARTGGG